jgi:hypothetical protein
VLLKYSEAAQVWVNAFIDDDLELPDKLPCKSMDQGIQRKPLSNFRDVQKKK